jgi:D-beta-D-heptose 7-phosphate kinase/D-beta-D-heptose 1-phosphate adenosyltransferase
MVSRLVEAVRRLRSPRVLVVGDLILDRYVWGDVNRISPEAPVQILDASREELRLGGAANVAHNAAVLGARATCAGVVGRDAPGAGLVKLIQSLGVSATGIVKDATRPTTLKTRLLAHNQQMLRIDHERRHTIAPPVEKALSRAVARAAATADVALVSDYNKGTMTPRVCRSLIDAFRKRGKPVLVGLKSRDIAKYARATGASLNRAELALVSGVDDVAGGARKIVRRLGLEFLAVTLGDKGLQVYGPRGPAVTLDAVARQVYDVTGAGDTVLAAFGTAYACGLPLEECALMANAAAGIVVGKVGTATVTRDELLDHATHGDESGRRKVLDLSALLRALEGERKRGKRVVFTNGCFDLLHSGHLSLLRFAKSRGDVVVVGLNTDRSVRKLKGASRPIQGAAERSALLAALECVDYVTLFDEDTPERLIRRVKPDVLVKDEDYASKKVAGRDFVTSNGGRVEFAPRVRGVSTTDLVSRIRRRP